MTVDRAGSAVQEELTIRYHSDEVLRDVVLTSTWYIWWMRRQFVHKEKNSYGNAYNAFISNYGFKH
jgi:hypothetical protein